MIGHVERVAAAVPAESRATAWLHDLFEIDPTVGPQLCAQGLGHNELEALELLRHAADEPYEVYVRRIVDAPGPAGRIARVVKLADLDDHLAHTTIPDDAPPYALAREQLLTADDG